ncbi:hypothetical protein NM208_g340 [Fusarium decemcellulare]|uniref:Uncharacterized protein n=1 Tax=Fusarium decemcellulare TaxID=57161 RepID=A0ACC1T056_9HYPO|nr:hypothetical protein NM208_g340 [Fusarium decemcellulare]
MGICSASSQTVLPYSREQVYDFVTNPHNWPLTYKGSGGIQQHLTLPLKLGDQWVEKVSLAENTYYSKWTLITAIRPWKWAFLQADGIGATDEAISDGVPGTTKIEYNFEEANVEVGGKTQRGCLFKRTLTIDLPRGGMIPEDLLVVCMRTSGIEGYHDAVARELAKVHGG